MEEHLLLVRLLHHQRPLLLKKRKRRKRRKKKKKSQTTTWCVHCFSTSIVFKFWYSFFYLHCIGFRTFRLIYFTSYDFLGKFVTSLVRCGIKRVHVVAPCQIFWHKTKWILNETSEFALFSYISTRRYSIQHNLNVMRNKLSSNCVLSIVLLWIENLRFKLQVRILHSLCIWY